VSEPAEHGGQTSSKAVKKAKTRQGARNKLTVFENSDDDEQPQALFVRAYLRAYLHLETTSQQPSRGKKSAAVITKSSQCNPFIFTIDTSFDAFIQAVANAANATTMNLTVSRLRWKFETPASLPMKLLTDEVGFGCRVSEQAMSQVHRDIGVILRQTTPRRLS
jgi:hypothetical protein